MASTPTVTTRATCAEPNCNKPLRARGFCVACYYRKLRCGDIVAGAPVAKWKHRLSNIDEISRTADCSTCGPVKIRSRGATRGSNWRCGIEADNRSKLYKRAYRESRKAQLKSACEICGGTEKLCWDHCHSSGEYRGTLCSTCNTGIGMMMDDPQRLRAAASYLESKTQ